MSFATLLNCGSTVTAMTEPPRPPGDDNRNDPTRPFDPYAANEPTSASAPPPPPDGPPTAAPSGYEPPPDPPTGYGTPPPHYGYQQQPPPGHQFGASQDDRTWILVAHFGGPAGILVGLGLGGWIAPLIALLARGNQSPVVRTEAIKALNFQLLWALVGLIGWATICLGIGFVIMTLAALVAIIFGVVAGVKAVNNEPYNYPMTVNFIK